jgi:hypothetical protein
MKTVTDNFTIKASEMLSAIDDLLGDPVRYRDVNDDSSSLMIMGAHYAFPDLPLEKKRLQSRLNQELIWLFSFARALLLGQPKDVQRIINQAEKALRDIIEQNHLSWHSGTLEAQKAAKEAISDLMQAISCLYDTKENAVILVPDTNALIGSPAIRSWIFDDVPEFELLLTPTLLSELDSLKIDHRNPDVRNKAQEIIRQIKEYRRRGSLEAGVIVIKNRITIRSMAIEPKVKKTLPWLDPESQDDRMLASCIQAMRGHPRSTVALVTGDINLQNKAEFAGVPFLEPPSAP